MSPRPLPEPMTGLTPKRTTGGTFDPSDPFTFFTATGPDALARMDPPYPTVLCAVNETYSGSGRRALEQLLDEGRKVFLDSGIFNLAMNHVRAHGTSHDEALQLPPEEIDGFEKLWEQYGELATTYGDRLWGIVELDQGGVTNKPRTRARIEKEIGITPIPVYHPLLDGWDYYDELAQGYDRLCFGNIVQAAPTLRMRLLHTAYMRAKQYPHLWTHLLGYYPNQNVLALPIKGSSDASAWLTPIRWQPSWKGWSMLQMMTHYPPSMWGHRGSQGEDYDPAKSEAICVNTSFAVQSTLDDVIGELRELTKEEAR